MVIHAGSSTAQFDLSSGNSHGQLYGNLSNALQAAGPARTTDPGADVQEPEHQHSSTWGASSLTQCPSKIAADKATQVPEEVEGVETAVAQGPSPGSLQALAWAIVMAHHQSARMQASMQANQAAQADAARQLQAASFEKTARLRAQQQASATAAALTDVESELQEARSKLSARDRHAEAAAEKAIASAAAFAAVQAELNKMASDVSAEQAKIRMAEAALKEATISAAIHADVQAELQRARSNVSAQEAFARQAEAAQKDATNHIGSLQHLNTQAIAICSALKRQLLDRADSLKVSEAAARRTGIEISNLQTAKEQASGKCTALQQQLHVCEEALEASKAAAATAQHECSGLRSQLESTEQQVRDKAVEQARLEHEVVEADRLSHNLKVENERLHKVVDDHASSISVHESAQLDVAQIQHAKDQVLAKCATLQQELDSDSEALQASEAAAAAAHYQCSELKAQLESAKQQVRDQAVDLARLEHEVVEADALAHDLQVAAKRMQKVSDDQSAAAVEMINLQTAKDHALAKCKTLQQELDSRAEALQSSHDAAAAAQCQHSELKAQLKSTQQQVQDQADRLACLGRELDKADRIKQSILVENEKLHKTADGWAVLARKALTANYDLEQQDKAALLQAEKLETQRLKGVLKQCEDQLTTAQGSLAAEHHAAAASRSETEKLQQQLTHHLSHDKAVRQQLQQSLAVERQLVSKSRSEGAKLQKELRELERTKMAGDQTIAAHWRASAAKDASIKDASVKLADALDLVRLPHWTLYL